jgi:hypothetical protein
VLVDDVVIFSGNNWLPGLDAQQIRQQLNPRVTAGIRVDRKTVAVKLLQNRHPLALGAIAMLACSLVAVILLLASFVPLGG